MNESILGDLRGITEENDLNTILKPVMGGYSKRSVLEYFAYLQKQQQDARDAYTAELSRLQNDKEALELRCAGLQTELDDARARLRDAADRSAAEKPAPDPDRAEEEKEKLAAADARAEDALTRLQAEQEKNAELERILSELTADASALPPRADDLAEAFSPEAAERTRERLLLAAQSAERLRRELTERTAALDEELRQLEDSVREQTENDNTVLEGLRGELQASRDRGELLTSENEELTRRVRALSEQNVQLGTENTRLKAANRILQRRAEVR